MTEEVKEVEIVDGGAFSKDQPGFSCLIFLRLDFAARLVMKLKKALLIAASELESKLIKSFLEKNKSA